ncbi:MAG TPA: 3-methyl-2-oxobutanoate hydroxymethyltransferase, partial [Dongiaceae bacterium]|nr:3-methyl-2-oxobutanoate hydroxymethyltransferase [Dongiaceae bacterium]
SYHTGKRDAIRNAGRFLKEAGAAAVKIEGGSRRAALVKALVDAEIPVRGHVGLTPQSVHLMGGYKVQGKRVDEAAALVEDAQALEEAGIFSLVLEGMPESVGRRITESIGVPTIGIGAGRGCDGQVLVFTDFVGLSQGKAPRFVRRYADLAATIEDAARRFAADVRSGDYPSVEETYTTPAAAPASSRTRQG